MNPKKSRKKVKEDLSKFKPNSNKEADELARRVLRAYLADQRKDQKQQRIETESLISINQEFLDNFILLGYTPDGAPVQIAFAHNQKEADALATLLNKFYRYVGSQMDGEYDNPNDPSQDEE